MVSACLSRGCDAVYIYKAVKFEFSLLSSVIDELRVSDSTSNRCPNLISSCLKVVTISRLRFKILRHYYSNRFKNFHIHGSTFYPCMV